MIAHTGEGKGLDDDEERSASNQCWMFVNEFAQRLAQGDGSNFVSGPSNGHGDRDVGGILQ